MNDTKWLEIFKAFYYQSQNINKTLDIFYRTQYADGTTSNWSNEWELFGCAYQNTSKINWLQIELTDTNREYVMDNLKKIHVPGDIQDSIVTVYGYRQDVDYIK
ncbi:MAG: hypothetical protein GX051_00185 [Clostridiales bacterium]|nr:hypothetical protein [Clostridiales bacterium]